MHPSELDLDEIFALFTETYVKATGTAQTREWFERHFWTWQFFGTKSGMIAVRFQGCGLIKLTGMAGSRRGMAKGLGEVMAMNRPVWGAVSADLLGQARRAGFVTPPAWVIRVVLEKIGGKITKGRLADIHRDGSFSIRLSNIGPVRKYFISNREYYAWLIREAPSRFADDWKQVPRSVTMAIRALTLPADVPIGDKNLQARDLISGLAKD